MPATPRRGRRFGGTPPHQRLMMANLVASLIAAEGIVTTEAKAKALRPIAEKLITKAKKGRACTTIRQIVSYLGDKEMAAKLFDEVGPRYADRNGGYTAHPQARPAPGRQRPHGAHRTGLLTRPDAWNGPPAPNPGAHVTGHPHARLLG